MPKVKIKSGCSHRVETGNFKNPSRVVKAGDIVDVSDAEMEAFGDKFETVSEEKKSPRKKS